MGSYKEIEGNLITLAKEGTFDAIMHGANCFCTMGSGIAPQMKNAFGVDKYPLEAYKYKGDINKLGQIDFQFNKEYNLYVVNGYTQYDYNRNAEPEAIHLDLNALTMCLRKLNHIFKGKKIGLPMIGAGRAGGDWRVISHVIKTTLEDVDVTIVKYKR